MTNRRAIHSAATSEAKTLTHHDSTTSRLAIADAEHQPVEQKPHDGRCDAALQRERLQQLLEFESGFVGRTVPVG